MSIWLGASNDPSLPSAGDEEVLDVSQGLCTGCQYITPNPGNLGRSGSMLIAKGKGEA